MTTPLTPQIYPLSIIANGWFRINPDLGLFAFNPAPRQSVGLCACFDTTHITCLSDDEHKTLRDSESAIAALKTRLAELPNAKNSLSLSSNPEDLKQALQRKIIDLEATQKTVKESATQRDFAIFETSKGRCAFNLNLDTAADMVALAQGGMVIELVHDETGYAPSLIARTPQPRIKRQVTLPKPKLTPANRSTP